MCTQVACQNQINVLTVFGLAKKFACDEYDFIGQSEVVFLRILPEVSDPRRCIEGSRPLGTRLLTILSYEYTTHARIKKKGLQNLRH